MDELYYEDFHVGQSFTSRPLEITRERIVAFGEEFDPQPQHISEAAAATSNFGTLIASGWHTAAVSMRLQFEAAFCRIAGGGVGAGIENLTWLRPVRPGDALHVVVEVSELRPSNSRPDRGVIRFLTTTVNQHGQSVATMFGTVLVPRRAS
jgi:acyl dehydratase